MRWRRSWRLGTLRAFLDEQRYDGLTGLSRSAVIHFAEMPRVAFRPPKGLDKFVPKVAKGEWKP